MRHHKVTEIARKVADMKHILSVSLGSASRDKSVQKEILGEQFLIERRGTDGDLKRFSQYLIENDGKVDCLCLGGTNLGLHWGGRFYGFRDVQRIVRQIKQTPVVDGAGLKNSLERETIRILQDQGTVNFTTAKVLVTCATDRFGMTEAICELTSNYILGDLMFTVGVPIALHSTRSIDILARLLLPILRRTLFKWLYPTGSQQDSIQPKYQYYYQWADVIASDFLIIRRHLPDRLAGKIVITNTTTQQDVEALRSRDVHLLITTTPVIEGRSFATNVMEGVFLTLMGKQPGQASVGDYLEMAQRIGWQPEIRELNPLPASSRNEGEPPCD